MGCFAMRALYDGYVQGVTDVSRIPLFTFDFCGLDDTHGKGMGVLAPVQRLVQDAACFMHTENTVSLCFKGEICGCGIMDHGLSFQWQKFMRYDQVNLIINLHERRHASKLEIGDLRVGCMC